MQCVDMCLQDDPSDVEAWQTKASILEDMGNKAQAADAWAESQKLKLMNEQ